MKKLIYNKMNKAAIPDLPRVGFPGKIVVVVTAEEAERCVDYLLTQELLGFDTETRPAFTKGAHFKCSLLQVSTDDICFLFRLNLTGLTADIIRLLEATNVKKVGLAWQNDIIALKELGDFQPAGFVDLQNLVKQVGIEDQGLAKIYANLVHGRISKTERLSNWERDVLKESQKAYAAIDAWACVEIYKELVRLIETDDYELAIVPEEPIKPHDETNLS